jgi:hypothetical protein
VIVLGGMHLLFVGGMEWVPVGFGYGIQVQVLLVWWNGEVWKERLLLGGGREVERIRNMWIQIQCRRHRRLTRVRVKVQGVMVVVVTVAVAVTVAV